MNAVERYKKDPLFNKMVNSIKEILKLPNVSKYDIIDAVFLAECILWIDKKEVRNENLSRPENPGACGE